MRAIAGFAFCFVFSSLFAATNIVRTNDPFCELPLTNVYKQGSGTLRMVARLEEIRRTADPKATIYFNREMLPGLRQAQAATTNAEQLLSIRAEYATQLLRAGLSAEAVQEFNALGQFVREKNLRLSAENAAFLQLERALAYLRVGEQENCLLNHTADSCLFPIQGTGVHQLPRGSRGAVNALGAMLHQNSRDLGARWLLNIAYMTLGEYPDKVPKDFLIPPSVFASDYDLPRFPEAAGAAGVDVDDLAGGCIAEDFDGDGLLDIMASSWGLSGQLRFFHNNGDGTFSERTDKAGLLGLTGALNLLSTDYNNDGHIDVLMLRGAWLGKGGHHPNSLLRNNGDGTFEDVTEEAGLLSFHPTQTATWFDFDGDGWIDLFIGNESSGTEQHPCELYRNNGNGTFTECAAASGVGATGFIKGVGSGDFNNDGRPDL
ncbi:MAG TPA: VCBS repeat-containing protein, partial [Verrucomicrobiae bacterium]